MNTHDIKLPPLPPLRIAPSVEPVDYPDVAQALMDYALAAIEADRKRKQSEAEEVCGEAYQVVGSLLSDLGIFETEHAEKILDNLSQAKKVHKDVLPWPSFDRKRRGEPVKLDRYDAGLLGGQDGMPAYVWHDIIRSELDRAYDFYMDQLDRAAPQPAEPQECGCCGRSDGCDPDCDAAQPAEPVKRKRRYAQGTALGEFGIIPMCDQVDDEPVKVVSDDEIMSVVRYSTVGSAAIQDDEWCAFARALLARYGQQAQPTSCQNESMGEHACSDRSQCWEPCGDLGKSEEHARVYDPPVTEQEEEAWQQMEKTNE